jgi:hypothetical protein
MSKLWFRPVFVCPVCASESFNPNDIRENYCGRCHKFFRDDGQPELRKEPEKPYQSMRIIAAVKRID